MVGKHISLATSCNFVGSFAPGIKSCWGLRNLRFYEHLVLATRAGALAAKPFAQLVFVHFRCLSTYIVFVLKKELEVGDFCAFVAVDFRATPPRPICQGMCMFVVVRWIFQRSHHSWSFSPLRSVLAARLWEANFFQGREPHFPPTIANRSELLGINACFRRVSHALHCCFQTVCKSAFMIRPFDG